MVIDVIRMFLNIVVEDWRCVVNQWVFIVWCFYDFKFVIFDGQLCLVGVELIDIGSDEICMEFIVIIKIVVDC